jgi:hypothetical protein
MDVTILRLAIGLEVIILTALFKRGLYAVVPVFTVCILSCLIQGPWLHYVHQTGTDREYFLAYYAIDLMTIALYILAIAECWKKGYLATISATMFFYLLFKGVSYFFLVKGATDAALNLLGNLRYLNLGCYALWASLVWGYDVFGIKFRSR